VQRLHVLDVLWNFDRYPGIDTAPIDSIEARDMDPLFTEQRFQRFTDAKRPALPLHGPVAGIMYMTRAATHCRRFRRSGYSKEGIQNQPRHRFEHAGIRTTDCSKSFTSKAAASEERKRTLRYVESLSDARTPLVDFFNSLLRPVL
jgi:hypothetical protein